MTGPFSTESSALIALPESRPSLKSVSCREHCPSILSLTSTTGQKEAVDRLGISPRDYGKLTELIRRWVLHSIERYGREALRSWN